MLTNEKVKKLQKFATQRSGSTADVSFAQDAQSGGLRCN